MHVQMMILSYQDCAMHISCPLIISEELIYKIKMLLFSHIIYLLFKMILNANVLCRFGLNICDMSRCALLHTMLA